MYNSGRNFLQDQTSCGHQDYQLIRKSKLLLCSHWHLLELKILTPSVSRVFRLAMTLDSDPGIPNSGLYINPEILELPYVLTREWQTGPGLQVLAMTNFKMVSTKFFASSARNRLTKCKFNSGIEVHWQIPLHRVTTHLLFLKNTNAFVF